MRRPDFLYLSPSRMRLSQTCAAAHAARYVEKREPMPATTHMRMGTAIHSAIEAAAQARWDRREGGPITQEEIVALLAFPAVELSLTEEEVKICRETVADLAVVDIENQATPPEFAFFVEVDLERSIGLKGVMDFVANRHGHVLVSDWKTGRGMPIAHDDAPWDPQVGAYLVAARRLWPSAKSWSVSLVYPWWKSRVTVEWSRELDNYHVSLLRAVARRIVSGASKANIGPHCSTCQYRNTCKPYVEHVNALRVNDWTLEALEDDELISLRAKVAEVASLADGRRKDLDRELKRRIGTKKRIDGETTSARLITRRDRVVDPSAVAKVADALETTEAAIWREIAKRPSRTKLVKFVSGNADAIDIIERHTTTKPTQYIKTEV